MERWTAAEATAWQRARPWVCGCNFIPSTAVNFLDMWRADGFDRARIETELGWAADIGFNAVRVNLHYLVWAHDRDGLLDRLDWFLGTAARRGIDTVPCLFDDCGFGGAEPVYRPQPDPVPGVHNSRAVASPGRARVMDRMLWPRFEAYLRDVISAFRDDPRVLFWDLYNEPGNRMVFRPDGFHETDAALVDHSLALMTAGFGWAREVGPAQPLAVAAWTTPTPGSGAAPYATAVDRAALSLSDIVTFHAYCDAAHAARFIDTLAGQERPMVCTEWMARGVGSRIDDQLPLFHGRGVGCFQWGFVRGRTQTDLPWPEALVRAHGGRADPGTWFHDLLHRDGTPYDPREVGTVAELTGRGRDDARDIAKGRGFT